MARLGFKATNLQMMCKGVKFNMGVKHHHYKDIAIGESGFHFCNRLIDVENYYTFSKSRVFIVQIGSDYKYDGAKGVTNEISFLHEINDETIQELVSGSMYKSLMTENTVGLMTLFMERNDVKTVHTLLDIHKDLHADKDYAMRWASECGHTEIVAFLLDRGADIHSKKDYALRWASNNGHIETVAFLLDRGADIHAEDDFALRRSKANHHTEIVKLLIDRYDKT